MLRLFLLTLFLFYATAFLQPISAQAHPHAWIDYQIEAIFGDSNKLTALHQHWQFDEYYTEFALNDFDDNGNKKLDTDELLRLAKSNISNLKDFDYFTSVQKDGVEITFQKVTGITSSMVDGKIKLSFTLWLSTPLDVSEHKVEYRIYDPTYYTAMLHLKNKQSISLKGNAAQNCSFVLKTPKPDIMTIQFATELGKDTKAPDQLGRFFAQRVTLSCP